MTKDEYGYLGTNSFSWGIMHIFMAYIALIGRTIGEFRHNVDEDEFWTTGGTQRRRDAETAIWMGAFEGLGIMTLLIIAAAVAIPLVTNPLDDRMVLVIEGFSRLVAGCVQGLLSLRIAIWLDVYYWRTHRAHKLGTTIIELKHRIRWGVCKMILRMFFLLCVLFQGVDAVTIPVSIIAGVAAGAAVDLIIYKLRRVDSSNCRRGGCIALVAFLCLVSIAQLANGILFIAAVWDDSADDVSETWWDAYAFLVLMAVVPITHIVFWQMGKCKRWKDVDAGLMDEVDENSPKNKLKRHRMVTSMFISVRNSNSNDRQKADPFHQSTKDDDNKQEATHMEALAEEPEGEDSTSPEEASGKVMEAPPEAPASAVGPDPDPEEGQEVPHVVVESEHDDENISYNNISKDGTTTTTTPEPTLWQLMMDWQFCGCVRGDDKTTSEKVIDSIGWFFYIIVCLACCFSVFNNAGATQQQEAARAKLPEVNRLIYANMDLGPVCAFDNKGADSNITTFPSKDAAHEAGFLIVHCGACGACSDWHNLRLEYTTRDFLAAEGRKCAQQSLFGGGYDTLVECLESDAIGFQGQCAICWADDILCTKDFCWQIGLQSFFINTLTNFEVTNNTITSAACEEAHCEAKNPGNFVECSGATRRRMNITSSIARPGAQRCSIVDVDWAELFPEE